MLHSPSAGANQIRLLGYLSAGGLDMRLKVRESLTGTPGEQL